MVEKVPMPTDASDQLAYLEAHGEDVASLRSELESILPSNRTETPTADEQVLSSEPDYRLPISRDGSEVKLDPLPPRPVETRQPEPRQQPTQQQVTQEQALDPLAPDAPKTRLDAPDPDAAPGEVLIDQDGKVRDARTGRFVPHQAFHEERLKRKELEAKTSSQQELLARAQERLSVLTEIIQGQEQLQKSQAEPKPAEPEAEIDPEADVFAAVKQVQRREAERAQKLADIERAAHQRIDALQQEALYRQDAINFSIKHPDYPEAYRQFNEKRRDELKILGLKDEKAIDNQLMTEERALMALGLRERRSPAEIIYQMALNRGYAPKQPEPVPTPQPQPVVAATPSSPAAQVIPQVAADAAQKVQRLQTGVNASATLSGAGGVSGEGMTVQQLADMSEEEFSQFVGRLGGMKKLDRILGWKG